MSERIKIDQLRLDGGTQPREAISKICANPDDAMPERDWLSEE